MKALSSPGSPTQRTNRRVSKPLMEKRRRERINNSLETLRLLMLDSTHSEKLKNPKVEKAEILESVVEFLKTEKEMEKGHQAMKRVLSREQRPTCSRQQNYQDGMRSCLLRVSHFIANKSQELEEAGPSLQTSFTLPETQTPPASPGLLHRSVIPAAAGNSAAGPPRHLPHHHYRPSHHPYLHCDTRKMISSTAVPTHIADPVWRPWPQ